jgi:hypothetical protein
MPWGNIALRYLICWKRRNLIWEGKQFLSSRFFWSLIEHNNDDAHSKLIRAELQKTRELLRAAVSRAPLVRIASAGVSDEEAAAAVAGPDFEFQATSSTASIEAI